MFIVESALSLSSYFTGTPFKYMYNITGLNPNQQEATSWLFTSMAEDLNSGRPRTNLASGQSGTWIRDCWIASPMHWPLSNTTSLRIVDSRDGPFPEWAFISNYAIKNSRANESFCQKVLYMTNESYADG